MRFGSRGPSEFFSQIRHPNALTEIAWEEAKQGVGGNVYRGVIEKQGIVAGIIVYRQPVLQTVICVGIASPVFRRHDLMKIVNFNPQREDRFSLWKKLVPRAVRATTRSGYVISCNLIGSELNQNIDLTAKGLSSTEMSNRETSKQIAVECFGWNVP